MTKRVLVLGAGGMIGQKLLARLVRDGIGGEAAQITAHDIAFPESAVPVDRQIIGSVTERLLRTSERPVYIEPA